MGNVASVRARLGAALFVGRVEEAETLTHAVRRHRLVTLTGPGGVGKTRLAVEVAAAIGGEVWIAELARVTDPAGVPGAVASALGLRATDPASAVADRLALTPLLLVLDNAEHVLDPVADLLRSIGQPHPGVRILVTSRRLLAVPDEEVVSLRPFEPPGDLAGLEASDAGRLFVDRATRARASFKLDGDAANVVRILRVTGGFPLAIELAAARVRHLSCAEIAAGLETGSRLLRASDPDVPERHSTLEAAIAWSWELLSDPEQKLLRRLGVFAGAVTADAVRAVCGADADTLFHLVDASAVVADIEPGEVARYYLYDSVRTFARERNAEAGESESIAHAHMRWLLNEAESLKPRLDVIADADALRMTEQFAHEILAALFYATDKGMGAEAAKLLGDTFEWWKEYSRLADVADAVSRAARSPGVLRLECAIARTRGDGDAARAAYAEAKRLAAGDRRTELLLEIELCDTEFKLGSSTEAERVAARVLPIAREIGEDKLIRLALITHAQAAVLCDMYPEAQGDIEELLGTGEPGLWETGVAHVILAGISSATSDLEGTLRHYEEALPDLERSEHPWAALVVRSQIAHLRAAAGDSAAEESLERMFEESTKMGNVSNAVDAAVELGALRLRGADLAGARNWCTRAIELSARSGPTWRARALRLQSNIEQAGGRMAEAEEAAECALTAVSGEPSDEALCERRLASVLAARADYNRAAAILRSIRSRAAERGWHHVLRLAAMELCATLLDTGEVAGARAIAEDLRGADGLEPDLPALRASLARAEGDLASARRFAADAIRWSLRTDASGSLPHLLELQAAIDADAGAHERAARLLGAAKAARGRYQLPLSPGARPGVAATTAVVSAALGAAKADELTSEGTALTLDAAASEALTEASAQTSAAAVFRREDRSWFVRFEGREHRYPHALGFAHLARLLAHPGNEIHVLELGPNHVQGSDAGPVLDEEAKRAYRTHLADLERDVAQAEDWGDMEKASRLREEIERITSQLSAAVGLGGRDRRAASTSERARVAVRKAISSATKRIERNDPALARYLSATIRTGTFCVYQPDERQPVTWELA